MRKYRRSHITFHIIMNHSLVTIANLSRDKIMYLITMAQEFEKNPNRKILDGRIIATLFLSLPRVPVFPLRPPPTVWERVSSVLPILRSPVRPKGKP